MQIFLELQCLVDDSKIIKVYQYFFTLNILFDEVDGRPEHEKEYFAIDQLYHFFLKTATKVLN